jgi:TatD DNase family protein
LNRWTDTHAHLDSAKFEADREAVLQRAIEAQVVPIVTVGADLASSRAAVALAERFPGIYATVGVHPHKASCVDASAVDGLRDLASHPRVVAVGEVGLDYYYEFSPPSTQRQVFEMQLALASDLRKPVVIHLRDKRDRTDAYDHALGLLSSWAQDATLSKAQADSPVGVLHCFSGTREFALRALELGFCIGVDGPVTFPNARSLQSLVTDLPLDRLVLETDCPYLAPQARRGKRNEPSYLPYIGEKVAELKQLESCEVARATTANAEALFGLELESQGG